MNAAAERLTGWEAEELIGSSTDGEARLIFPQGPRATVLEFFLVPGWRRYWETPLTPAASASVS